MKQVNRSKRVLCVLFLGLAVWGVVVGLANYKRQPENLVKKPKVEHLDVHEKQLMLDKALLVLGGAPLAEEEVKAEVEPAILEKKVEEKTRARHLAEFKLKAELANRNIPLATPSFKPGRVISPYPPYNVIDVTGLKSGSVAGDPSTVPLDPETGKPMKNQDGSLDISKAKRFLVP